MAIAGTHETLLSLTLRINDLNNQIMHLQSQKGLVLYSQQDSASLKMNETSETRRYYKQLYESDPQYALDRDKGGCGYVDYTEIPDFEDAINIITAKYTDQMEELATWENQLDNQLMTLSAELEEAKAYKESFKTTLTSNIQGDYSFGLGQN